MSWCRYVSVNVVITISVNVSCKARAAAGNAQGRFGMRGRRENKQANKPTSLADTQQHHLLSDETKPNQHNPPESPAPRKKNNNRHRGDEKEVISQEGEARRLKVLAHTMDLGARLPVVHVHVLALGHREPGVVVHVRGVSNRLPKGRVHQRALGAPVEGRDVATLAGKEAVSFVGEEGIGKRKFGHLVIFFVGVLGEWKREKRKSVGILMNDRRWYCGQASARSEE